MKLIGQALTRGRNPGAHISEIRIFLEKHGEFYHPARIDVSTPDGLASLVLNVAVSDSGRKGLEREFDLLIRLGKKPGNIFTPRVCGKGIVLLENGREISMFLGQWFDGFHEFHLSPHPVEKRPEICVWTPDRGGVWLTDVQTRALYREISRILTFFYNTETYDQVFPWHHAAGDFIVRPRGGSVDVRLVTVRDYRPLVDATQQDPRSVFEALLAFLLNLTIRIRLDRLNGTGEIVWADRVSLEAVLDGFFAGLSGKSTPPFLPGSLDQCALRFLLGLKEEDLFEYAGAIVDSCPPGSPDTPVINIHIKDHISALHQALSALPPKQPEKI